MTDADTLRESLLDLHDLDRHHVEIDAGDDCEDCVIVLEPLARLTAENERLREALDAIERLDTLYTVGSDENLDRARVIARALHPEGETG